MAQDHMVLPWDEGATPPPPAIAFTRHLQHGESLEFEHNDTSGAVASYRHALDAARAPSERCGARVSLGRVLFKAGMVAESVATDRDTLQTCGDVTDGDAVPFALYAAERLLDDAQQTDLVATHVTRMVNIRAWRSPTEASALESLLRRLPGALSATPQQTLSTQIHNIEQITALARDLRDHPGTLQTASRTAPGDLSWMGYGDEPWLVTLVSPVSFATPVVMAVSSRRILPAGVLLSASPAPSAVPLGDGFVNLHASWPAGRFTPSATLPAFLYGSILAVVLGTVMLAGYLVLRDVHREAETAELRSHFVASVSHELKTPLTSIRAHAETLLLGRSPGVETTSEYLRTIVSESERLGRLVDTVLEFSRIEQGRKTYQMRVTPLDEVVRAAARTVEYPLSQMGFTLAVESDGSDPHVVGDPEALTQAVLNLLSNAMKYSGDARRIEMRTGVRGTEAFVDVIDHGIGIARSEQTRIFERFHRVQSADTSGVAGAGLGLALTLHLVQAHHGRIDVDSDVGRGSTFSVRIPLQDPS
jgi:hypothetical protein